MNKASEKIKEIMGLYSPEFVEEVLQFGQCERNSNIRGLSFDYCYEYFQTNQATLLSNMRQSCLELWAFLSSWGMMRGSTKLGQNGNFTSLGKTIQVIDKYYKSPTTIPNIANDSYKCFKYKSRRLYMDIESSLKGYNPTNTLITKIILGVFGALPALDTYFCNAFKINNSSEQKDFEYGIELIYDWYHDQNYQQIFDGLSIPCKSYYPNFTVGDYPIAKLIDMFGFYAG